LCIDPGEKRTGVAISDITGILASPHSNIGGYGNIPKLAEQILAIAAETNASKLVVGYPKNMDGSLGRGCEKVDRLINSIAQIGDMEIIKWDERLSTVAVHRSMHEMGYKTKDKKHKVDMMAAVYILQGYMESAGNKAKNEVP